MTVDLQSAAGGVILPVQAQPGARRNSVTGTHAGRLKVAVTQAPEKGKANKALMEVLSEALGLKRAQVQLLSGETNAVKKFLITGVDVATLRARVEAVLAGEVG